jgi:hypothetical protein
MTRVGANRRPRAEVSLEAEIAHLRGLDLRGLRARWRGAFKKEAPVHLPRHLLFGVLAYSLQADRLGDLDHETAKLLNQTSVKGSRPTLVDRLSDFDLKQRTLAPGTLLTRQWNDRPHRVMVLAKGFAWNGKTYDSLSKVAFAITGTKWNGPRFFGLRDKIKDDPTSGGRQ